MPEKFVAKTADFKDGERRIVFVGDNEIGVFRHEGAFYAYSNFCLHQPLQAEDNERLRPSTSHETQLPAKLNPAETVSTRRNHANQPQ